MRVDELLKIPEFHEFRIFAGDAMNGKNITSVNIIDSPDSYNYFKGGELLLTNTYIMKDDISILKNIIEACAKIGVAAIGIKLKRFVEQLPEEFIELANRLELPIILIPVDFAFTDIINRVLTEIINKQLKQLEYSEKVNTSFIQLVLQGGSIQQIIDNLSEILGKSIRYYDTYFERLYCSDWSAFRRLDNNLEPIADVLEKNVYYTQKDDKKCYGYLVVMGDRASWKFDQDIQIYWEIAIQHASTILKLNIQKEISNSQIEFRHRNEFIQGLLLNNFTSMEQVNSKAQLYGWEFSSGVVAMVVALRDNSISDDSYDVNNVIVCKIRYGYPKSMYTMLGGQIVFLMDPGNAGIRVFIGQLQKYCQQMSSEMNQISNIQIRAGIGSHKKSLLQAYESYAEAQKAHKAADSMNCDVSCYDNLGIYRLLTLVSGTDCEKEYLENYIYKLTEYDKKNNTEYLNTLQCLVEHDWNLHETAKVLYVHYNTIKYRYNKIAALLDVNLHESDVKLNIAIALKLMIIY